MENKKIEFFKNNENKLLICLLLTLVCWGISRILISNAFVTFLLYFVFYFGFSKLYTVLFKRYCRKYEKVEESEEK